MLQQITPVILTLNEAANIGRTLARLTWAERVVVVDSFSTDATLQILAEFPNVRLYQRPFDNHVQQWRFATADTEIATSWILRLDADYVLSDALIAELRLLADDKETAAYRVSFDYAVFGKRLGASLYPPNTILLRRGFFQIVDRGHTEGWIVKGRVKTLGGKVIHDDRKSLERWVASQLRYMAREREALDKRKNFKTWLRKHPPLMPVCVFFYCLVCKGMIFRGKKGIYYLLERTMAEAILALLILDRSLRPGQDRESGRDEKPIRQ